MKNSLRALYAILLLAAPAASAQQINAETLKRDLRAILPEAARGFPVNNGLVSEDSYYGKTYGIDYCLFGLHKDATLEYEYAHDYKYSKPTNELFYFRQIFMDTSAAGKFMLANAETVLEEFGGTLGLKKVKVKQEKSFRDDFKVIEYRQNGKALIVLTQYLKSKHTTLQVRSPYRPADVKVANFLGCMVYSRPNFGFLSVVPIYGPALGDKEKVAADAYAKSGLVERNYQYEWMPGVSSKNVELKWEKQFRVTVMNPYTVE